MPQQHTITFHYNFVCNTILVIKSHIGFYQQNSAAHKLIRLTIRCCYFEFVKTKNNKFHLHVLPSFHNPDVPTLLVLFQPPMCHRVSKKIWSASDRCSINSQAQNWCKQNDILIFFNYSMSPLVLAGRTCHCSPAVLVWQVFSCDFFASFLY